MTAPDPAAEAVRRTSYPDLRAAMHLRDGFWSAEDLDPATGEPTAEAEDRRARRDRRIGLAFLAVILVAVVAAVFLYRWLVVL